MGYVFLFSPKDIDIKKVNGAPQYAFLQYCDIASVCKAIKKMDGEYLGNNRLKVRIKSALLEFAFTTHSQIAETLKKPYLHSSALVKVCLPRVSGWTV